MCFKTYSKRQHVAKISRTTNSINKNPIISKPPKHSQTLHLLRRLKIYLSRPRTLLLRPTLHTSQKEKKTTIRSNQKYSPTNMQSIGLYARMRNYTSRHQTLKYNLSQCRTVLI